MENIISAGDFIYFDNQATTPVDKHVSARMIPYLQELYGNSHSNDHYIGWKSKQAVDAARSSVATFINADADEIVFTSGATEANNLAILGTLPTLKKAGKSKIIVSTFEHKCVLESAKAAKAQGIEVAFLHPKSNGIIAPVDLRTLIDETVGLVSIMTVNNEIGTVQPIEELCRISHDVGALFHTDAVQAAIFIDLDVTNSGVDFLSLSAHKIYGPKGIGCLYIKRNVQNKITPIIYGGGQEAGLRSGTLPTMLCVGFGEACRLAKEGREKNIKHLKKVSIFFMDTLKKKYPRAVLNGDSDNRHPGNLNIQFPGIDSHSLLQMLQPIVAASTGSACNTTIPEPSYVLRAIGLTEEEAGNSIRFSFGLQNNEQQVTNAVHYIVDAIHSIQESSALDDLLSDETVVLQGDRKSSVG